MSSTIITGGSKGLGLEVARIIAENGGKAIVVARNKTTALAELVRKYDGLIHFVAFDLTRTDAIDTTIKAIRKEHGPVKALVNNAAVGIDGVLTTLKPNDIEAAIRVNLLAPILVARAVAKLMMVDGGGRMVNVSSVNALTGYSGLAVYAATKAGLIGFTRSLARELGPAHITVNAVAPGLLETDMVAGMGEETRARVKRRSPLNRFATTTEAANAITFLLSDKASGMTGSVITVDAGNSA